MNQTDEGAFPNTFSGELSVSAFPSAIPLVSIRPEATYIGRTPGDPLTAGEVRCAADCDGLTSYEELIEKDPEYKEIPNLLEYLVWSDTALCDSPQGERETWLVISPHPDDAELSLGGFILNHRERIHFAHLVCFSRVIRTRFPDSFPTAAEASAIRKDESFMAARMAGLSNSFLDFPEAFLRSVDSAEAGPMVDEGDISSLLRMSLFEVISQQKPTRIFAPAAIGNHPDHRMVFDIVVELFEQGHFPESAITFYEDTPYCASHLAIDDFVARFENSYFRPRAQFEDISKTLRGKLMLSAVYRSQFSRDIQRVITGIAERNAHLATPGAPPNQTLAAERLWTLEERAFAHNLAI